MYCYRRVLNVKWNQKISNERIIQKMGLSDPNLISKINDRKRKFANQIMERNGLGKLIIQGKMEHKRKVGAPIKEWFSDVKNIFNFS